MKNRNKSILGVIVTSLAMAVGVWISQTPHPINLKSHELQAVMVHCDASPEGRDVKAWQVAEFHMRARSKGGRGWSKPGYNDVIELNGNVVNLVPYNEDTIVQLTEIANGACEYNRIVRHVCYIGGMNKAYTAAKNTFPKLSHSRRAVIVALSAGTNTVLSRTTSRYSTTVFVIVLTFRVLQL